MTITDRLGLGLRGLATTINKQVQQVTAGGHTNTGATSNLASAINARLPKLRASIVPTTRTAVQLPPVGTSPLPGKTAAPQPRGTTTEATLGRGFRQIRRY